MIELENHNFYFCIDNESTIKLTLIKKRLPFERKSDKNEIFQISFSQTDLQQNQIRSGKHLQINKNMKKKNTQKYQISNSKVFLKIKKQFKSVQNFYTYLHQNLVINTHKSLQVKKQQGQQQAANNIFNIDIANEKNEDYVKVKFEYYLTRRNTTKCLNQNDTEAQESRKNKKPKELIFYFNALSENLLNSKTIQKSLKKIRKKNSQLIEKLDKQKKFNSKLQIAISQMKEIKESLKLINPTLLMQQKSEEKQLIKKQEISQTESQKRLQQSLFVEENQILITKQFNNSQIIHSQKQVIFDQIMEQFEQSLKYNIQSLKSKISLLNNSQNKNQNHQFHRVQKFNQANSKKLQKFSQNFQQYQIQVKRNNSTSLNLSKLSNVSNVQEDISQLIFLTLDTTSKFFFDEFQIQSEFTVMKKRPAGCFQVLCNEIIPLEGKFFFQVYLEKISFGIFSIGVCSLKRRGFENSFDSQDCVVLFGVGNTIMKGGKQTSKTIGNNRNLPKLQDDAMMKIVIDRRTQTIRWYRENEELVSTSLPQNLKKQKLVPIMHFNYVKDKVRLNQYYSDQQI